MKNDIRDSKVSDSFRRLNPELFGGVVTSDPVTTVSNQSSAQTKVWAGMSVEDKAKRIEHLKECWANAKNRKKHEYTDGERAAMSTRARDRIAKNGHPRGMLGKTHSQETKRLISIARKGDTMPREAVLRAQKTKVQKYGSLAFIQGQKVSWKQGWRTVGGRRTFFRSRWESNYARWLEFLKSTGGIIEWEHEPETFWFEGVKRGCVSYLPDFKVTTNMGETEYHEVKGWMDPKSITKLKRMSKYHPAVVVKVFGKDWFKANTDKLRCIIKDWETPTSKVELV